MDESLRGRPRKLEFCLVLTPRSSLRAHGAREGTVRPTSTFFDSQSTCTVLGDRILCLYFTPSEKSEFLANLVPNGCVFENNSPSVGGKIYAKFA